jgi:hypothetical protein
VSYSDNYYIRVIRNLFTELGQGNTIDRVLDFMRLSANEEKLSTLFPVWALNNSPKNEISLSGNATPRKHSLPTKP